MRFKDGNGANPRGRPRETRNFMAELTEVLEEREVATAGGRPGRR
jgi:hypothetical protein